MSKFKVFIKKLILTFLGFSPIFILTSCTKEKQEENLKFKLSVNFILNKKN
ncbi:hypothetical protein [Mycoplasma leonicaptivi]|uniref:hypothetical protein n=1 Tax=Mycoplasma leonicaptivi TaxID=36742 RepID=UPI000A9937E4|nr:hypothetical protein [Mycoplasma leonicaptivi]